MVMRFAHWTPGAGDGDGTVITKACLMETVMEYG